MDEAMLKSGQFPNIAIEAGTDPAEVMREHGREVIPDGEKYELDSREHEPGTRHMDNGVSVHMCPNDTGAHSNVSQILSDTREQLNEELMDSCLTFADVGGHLRAFAYVSDLLDRQAAITRAECKTTFVHFAERLQLVQNGYDAAVRDMQPKVDELTAERDEWKTKAEYQQEILDCDCRDIRDFQNEIDSLTAERDRLQADLDACETRERAAEGYDFREAAERWERAFEDKCGEVVRLTAERDQLDRDLTAEHALVVQFEHDNEELRHANNTLRASVAGLKMTVEKRTSDPVEIQAQLARFAAEWERADTRIQEQRLIACYAGKLAGNREV